ncbi:MAG: hypothetical protein K8R56_09115, partial [Candidatus Eisenbacteria bacterium]|nr:hypothetical protein [Candidatus Eisenbacteria bacterium]
MARDLVARLNTFAFAIAILLFAALGVAWWRDRVKRYDTPRFEVSAFEPIVAAGALEPARERWIVAVHLGCPHCTQHLSALAARIAARPSPPALGALLVDEPTRPSAHTLTQTLPAGVYWDRAQIWRERWGRRVYGETFRFSSDGGYLGSTPVGV